MTFYRETTLEPERAARAKETFYILVLKARNAQNVILLNYNP